MSGFKIYMIICLLTISGTVLKSQDSKPSKKTISGKITDEQSQLPLGDVIVQLINQKDSSLAKSEFSDEKGEFVFMNIDSGMYFIQTTLINYPKYSGGAFAVNENLLLPIINLSKSNINLNEVV